MNFGVLLFPQVEELDFVGPWELLRMWSRFASGPERCLLIAEHDEPISCANGMRVLRDVGFDDCPQLDFLLVPGGAGTRVEVNNPALLHFVARQAMHCRAVLSVCTGSFVLHAAGLLPGKRTTTHWGSLARLRALPGVTVVEQRWVRDGKIWCSAGVSAGMDMMLAFIAEHGGTDAAGRTQFSAEYFPDGVTYGNYESHEQAPAYLRRVAK